MEAENTESWLTLGLLCYLASSGGGSRLVFCVQRWISLDMNGFKELELKGCGSQKESSFRLKQRIPTRCYLW